jgi:hypothetical protein
MSVLMRCLVCLLCQLACSFSAHASDEEHRDTISRVLMASSQSGTNLLYPFITQLYVQREQGQFTLSSGQSLMSVSSSVASGYDASIAHQIGDFYQANNLRQRWVMNYLHPQTHWLISLGYDSGTQADKLSIEPSVFLGAAKNFELAKHHQLLVSWGQWLGGKVTERPCLDAYDREYWCPNLTAWKDKPMLNTDPGKYYELKYQWQF